MTRSGTASSADRAGNSDALENLARVGLIAYGLMHLLSTLPDVRGGFVHVPFSPEQVAASGKAAPSLGVDRVADALEVLVDTASKTTEDLAISAGAEH